MELRISSGSFLPLKESGKYVSQLILGMTPFVLRHAASVGVVKFFVQRMEMSRGHDTY